MSMVAKVLDQANFTDSIANGTVLVDFGAPWCAPCRAFSATFEKVAEANPDITFAEVNIEDAPTLATAFNIQAIPTLLVFREGVLVHSQPGAQLAHSLQRIVDGTKAGDASLFAADESPRRANAA